MDSPASARRSPRLRSAITNDPLALPGVDGRSAVARRFRDVAAALADDLGGAASINEATAILVRQAASLTVRVEEMQAAIVSGAEVNDEQMTRLSNTLGRTLQRLGLKRPAPKLRSPLAEHFAKPPAGSAT